MKLFTFMVFNGSFHVQRDIYARNYNAAIKKLRSTVGSDVNVQLKAVKSPHR